MKPLVIALLALSSFSALADEYVPGYYRKDGTYVPGYHRTVPDDNPFNNYSTQGNINPYTGKEGTVNPYQQPQPNIYQPPPTSNYGQPACGVNAYGQWVCR